MKLAAALLSGLPILALSRDASKDHLDGGIVDKNQKDFKKMTDEQKKASIMDIFKKADTNNDQKLEAKELQDLVRKAAQEDTKRVSKEDFTNRDTNNDGFVTWPEYSHAFGSLEDEDVKERSNPAFTLKTYVKTRKNLFDGADVNKDQKLDLDEYAGTIHPEQFKHMVPVQAKVRLMGMDVDKDGYLQKSEHDSYIQNVYTTGRKLDTDREYLRKTKIF